MKLDFKKKDNVDNIEEKPKKEKKEKKDSKLSKFFSKNKTNKLILIFLILVFIVDALILADAIHTKVVTYKALGRLVATQSVNDGKASKQGNLGNYNIVSKNNSVVDNKNGSYTLTVDLKFVNYGEEGYSFAEAVDLTAYQENKEVKGGIKQEEFSFGEKTTTDDEKRDESTLKVKNGKAANVFLTFTVYSPDKDVEIIMKSGANEFTYTVQLSKSEIQTAPAQNNPQQPQQNPNGAKNPQNEPKNKSDEEDLDDVEDLIEDEAANAEVNEGRTKEPA